MISEDEFDTMTNDLRQKSDRVYDTFKATGDQLDSDWDQMSDCLDRVKSQFDNIRGTISDAFDELERPDRGWKRLCGYIQTGRQHDGRRKGYRM